jgi:hypothetical protein
MSDEEVAQQAPDFLAAFPDLLGPAVGYTAGFVQRQILFLKT